MNDDDALREFALELFGRQRDKSHADTARLFGQGDPPVIEGTAPIDATRSPHRPTESVSDEGGWHGEVIPDGASWLFGGGS